MKRTITNGRKKGFVFFISLSLFLLSFNSIKAQSFSESTLGGVTIANPTSLQFGPDDRLYVSEQYGNIKIYTINKSGPNNYQVSNTEIVSLVKQIPNHYDNGDPKPYNINTNRRQVTGILVAGTSGNPVVYVASSDDDIGAGEAGDKNLCTNSGIISKLYKEGGMWKKIDLVRGLPRSEENHAPNGMQLHNNKLFISIGGFTNAGGVSSAWTFITEYALSSAILSIDLAAIEALPTKMDPTGNHPYKYDIPTLDDPTRANNPDGTDVNDPWGGNDGMNQAKVVPGGPVQLYATGFRNAYDLLITKTPGQENKMFTIDNGPNRTWGGWPVNEGTGGNTTNEYDPNEPGSNSVTNYDGLELIGDVTTYNPAANMYYGGHPCPIRANPAGAGLYSDNGTHKGWRNNNSNPNLPLPSDWPPVPVSMANPEEGEYHDPGSDKSLITFNTSVNGFCEYTADGPLKGHLLAAGFNGNIYHIKLNSQGQVLNNMGAKKLNSDQPIASGFGNKPLDITAQGNGDIFPGTVWIATWGSHHITVLEPQDIVACTGANNPALDEDMDGYNNAEEIASGTDPCSGSSKPQDHDGDGISDAIDPDDDDDGIPDTQDLFCIDPDNGLTTGLPTHYNLFNFDPGTGFYGLGFTGLMCNGTSNYSTLFDENNLIAGGAVGVFTIEDVPGGTALNGSNTQQYGFQFGVKTAGTNVFTVQSAIMPKFFGNVTPQNNQSQGIYIGTGDQDNYLSVSLIANGGAGGIEVVHEVNGVAASQIFDLTGSFPSNSSVKFFITVDVPSSTAHVFYKTDGAPVPAGTYTLSGPLLSAITTPSKAMAIGVMATSSGAQPFDATWDYLEAYEGWILSVKKWHDGTDAENIHIFPNPTDSKIMINVETLKNATYRVNLYNNLGQFIGETNMTWIPGNASTEIDVAHLPNGIYYLQFVSGDNQRSATVKFIKQ